MLIIGFVGAGRTGTAPAEPAIGAGYEVVLRNSRGPETLNGLIEQLGPRAGAATPAEAAAGCDVVVVTVPLEAYGQIPVGPLVGKVVIDTSNYDPGRSGHIAELDDKAQPSPNSCRPSCPLPTSSRHSTPPSSNTSRR
ncbi:MAG: NAD(P)-binding domain-containing protein [Nakamurella sp.]